MMLERPGVLTVGDRVVFGGFAHAVVAISGTKIRLLSDSGEASVVALPFLLAAEDFELVGSAPLPRIEPRGLLESLPEKALAEAREWERHVMEVETGLPPGAGEGATPRPQYDPATVVVTDREKAKAVELKVSARTVQRSGADIVIRDYGVWSIHATSGCWNRPGRSIHG